MHRLTLIRHATTVAVRQAAFPLDEPLDESGSAAAAALARRWERADHRCGPSQRARQTAALLGLDAAPDPALAECDAGSWHGRVLADLAREQPAAVAEWLGDPQSAPHGGESLAQVRGRVAAWLAKLAARDGRTVAVTSADVIKAAIAVALDAPLQAAWRVDASPLRCTVLHAHDGRWTLHTANAELRTDEHTANAARRADRPATGRIR